MLDIPVTCIMLISELWFRTATLSILPIFTPNDFMLEQHADKGEQDWEIYAWCVRDVIARAGQFRKEEFYHGLNKRYEYYDFINGRTDFFETKGKYFSYNSIESNDLY